MKKYFGITWVCFFLFLRTSVAQQFVEESWHMGFLVLDSQDTLQGQLKVNLTDQILQLNSNIGLKTYTATKVTYFQIFDKSYNQLRNYYSIPFPNANKYEVPTFFEVLTQGEKVTLLCRERLVVSRVNSFGPYGYSYGSPYMNRTRLQYDFYFLFKSGKIKSFSGSKKDLTEKVLTDAPNSLKEYIKENKLNPENRSDLANIVDFYNQKK